MTDRHHDRPPLEVVPPPDDDYGTSAPTRTPRDLAERALLGAMLRTKAACDDATITVTGRDLHDARYEQIWDAIVHLYSRGNPVDALTVADHLGNRLPSVGGHIILHELIQEGLAVTDAGYYADLVAKHSARDRLHQAALRIQQLTTGGGDIDLEQALAEARAQLDTIQQAIPGVDQDTMPGLTVDELLATGEEDHDWLIPGFLERGERLILTGGEGAGKSTLLRQWATQAAAGIHPFELHGVDPVKVLVVDLENSERQNKREYRRLRAAAKDMRPTNLVIHSKLDGLDLTQPADEQWLDRMLTHHKPDLLITGPIYKLAGGNPNDEKDAKPAAMALDRLRANHGVTLLLEAHSKKGESSNPKHRPKEPFGWSGWMRWPEFGLHIDADGNLTHWRGQRDAARQFPSALQRGGKWPWSPVSSLADQRWVAVREAIRAAGEKPTIRELAESTGIAKSIVDRILRDHSADVAVLLHGMQMED